MNTKRKLASIEEITKIENIEWADAIVKVSVRWWNCVSKKWEFKEGDKCVYFEIDSLLPIKEPFMFLEKWSKPKSMFIDWNEFKWFQLKTIKLRWQVSQWLALPLSFFPELKDKKLNIGDDVTELLWIFKYEKPIPAELSWIAKGDFPSFLSKTDEERIQNYISLLDSNEIKDNKFFITEKLDWSSTTYYFNNGEFWVCSRNLDLLRDENNSMWKFAIDNNMEEKLRKMWRNIALQWEIIWKWIQNNFANLNWQDIRFFNVFDIDKKVCVDFDEYIKVIETLWLKTVPILDKNIELKFKSVKEIEDFVTRKSTLNSNVYAEGCVFRPMKEQYSNILSWRLSFKCISPTFLLNGWE